MSWIIGNEKDIDKDTVKHLHSEIRTARAFWYDKSLAYLNWYASFLLALLSAFFLLLTKKDEFGPYLGLLAILPLIAAVLCHYARKSIRICYRQFLEHTAMMAKLDYVLGMYRTTDLQDPPFFQDDNFISPRRHFEYVQKFKREDQFVEAELAAPERTYHYKLRIFKLLQVLAVVLVLVILSSGTIRIAGVVAPVRVKDGTEQTRQQDQPQMTDKAHGAKQKP